MLAYLFVKQRRQKKTCKDCRVFQKQFQFIQECMKKDCQQACGKTCEHAQNYLRMKDESICWKFQY